MIAAESSSIWNIIVKNRTKIICFGQLVRGSNYGVFFYSEFVADICFAQRALPNGKMFTDGE